MKKNVLRIFAVAAALLVAGVALKSAAAPDAGAGKAVFLKKCQMCHGADGSGNPGMAKVLKVTFVPLGSPEVQKMSDADIKKIITEGKDKMKPVGGLSDDDIANVISFVRMLKK